MSTSLHGPKTRGSTVSTVVCRPRARALHRIGRLFSSQRTATTSECRCTKKARNYTTNRHPGRMGRLQMGDKNPPITDEIMRNPWNPLKIPTVVTLIRAYCGSGQTDPPGETNRSQILNLFDGPTSAPSTTFLGEITVVQYTTEDNKLYDTQHSTLASHITMTD